MADESTLTPSTDDQGSAATAETPVTQPAAAVSPSNGSRRGVIAAIAGGTAVLGLLIGLLIGWFAFDHDGGKGSSRGDKDRMSQQGPPMGGMQRGGRQDGGQQGGMMPGRGGQMMPGQGNSGGRNGQSGPGGQGQTGPGSGPTPSTPSTQGGATPQSLQQG